VHASHQRRAGTLHKLGALQRAALALGASRVKRVCSRHSSGHNRFHAALTRPCAAPRSGASAHPPSSSIAAQSAKAAHLGDQPAMGASLAKTGVSEDAALAAQGHTLHHTTVAHDASAPYLGPSGGAGSGLVLAHPLV